MTRRMPNTENPHLESAVRGDSQDGSGPARGWSLALCAVLLVAGCGGGNNNRNFNDLDRGDLRIFNAISNSPVLTFVVENNNFGSAAFGQVTPFTRLITGNYDTDVIYGDADGNTIELIDQEEIDIDQDIEQTWVLGGNLESPLRIFVEFDDPDVALDSVEVAVVHAAANQGTYDVFLTEPDAVLGAAGETASVAQGEVSPLVTQPAGAYRLRVRAANSNTVLYDSGPFDLVGGGRQLFAVVDYFGPGNTPIRVLRLGRTGAVGFTEEQLPTRLRFTNLLTDVNAADAFADMSGTVTSQTGILAGTTGTALELPAGDYGLTVTMETDPGTEFFSTDTQLVAGVEHQVVVSGSFTSAAVEGRIVRPPQRPISGFAQLTLTHAVGTTPSVDVYLLADGESVAGSVPRVVALDLLSTVTIGAPAGTSTLVLAEAGTDTEVSEPVSVTLTGAGLYTVIAGEAVGGGLPARLVLGGDFE